MPQPLPILFAHILKLTLGILTGYSKYFTKSFSRKRGDFYPFFERKRKRKKAWNVKELFLWRRRRWFSMKTVNIHLLSFQVEEVVVVGGGGWFLVTKPHRRCFYSKSFICKCFLLFHPIKVVEFPIISLLYFYSIFLWRGLIYIKRWDCIAILNESWKEKIKRLTVLQYS